MTRDSTTRAGHLSRSDPLANQGTTKAAFAPARVIPAREAGRLRRTRPRAERLRYRQRMPHARESLTLPVGS